MQLSLRPGHPTGVARGLGRVQLLVEVELDAVDLAGRGLKQIAIRLNDEGVPGPKAKRRGSGSWSPGQVRDIVRRERYRGVYVHGRVQVAKKGGKRVPRKADPSTVMRIEVPEWRIVDDLTWERAQATATQRAPRTKSENRATYALSGIARCGSCGGAIGVVNTKVVGGLRVRAYGCVWHHTRGDKVCAVKVRRPVDVMEKGLADAIRTICDRPDVVDVVLSALRQEVEAEVLQTTALDTGGLEAELIDLRRKERNLSRVMGEFGSEIPRGLIDELKAVSARAGQVERTLATATKAPVEAAALIAQAEAAVRARLADLRKTLSTRPAASRELYRGLLGEGGLTFMPDTSTRPARWIVRGALALTTNAPTSGASVGKTNGDPTGNRTRDFSVRG